MEEIQADQDCQIPAPLKMTITHASSLEPLITMTENGDDARQSLTNGNASSINQSSSSNTLQQGHGKNGTDDKQKHKTSSSHKSSLSSSSKDGSRHKDPTDVENQNGFSKAKDHRHSSSSSSNKPRDHSSSSRDKEKLHSSSSSSAHKDNHSSSKSKEHSLSSPKSESSLKNRYGSGGSSKEGSSSKNRECSSSREDVSLRASDGEKTRGSSEASKVHSSSSKSSSSHKESKDKHQSSSSDKTSRSDSGRSSAKHHHKSDRHSASDSADRSSELASPVQVKTEVASPSKAQLELKAVSNSDDEDDAPLFSRLKKADNVSKEMKVEPKDEDDEALFSRLKNVKSRAESDDDDVPLMARLDKVKVKPDVMQSPSKKRKHEDSGDESDEPLAARMEKVKKVKVEVSKKRKNNDDGFAPKKSKDHSSKKQIVKEEEESPKKGKKKSEADAAADETKWKWWEENKRDEGVKWKTLEHKGPVFAPPYEPLPKGVTFYYDGKAVKLSEPAEEVATFYARMLDHDYTTRDLFNSNFFKDWRKVMTSKERELITDLKRCNFNEMAAYFKEKSEERKNMSKEEKLALKKENEKIQKEYGFCIIDGHKQKIGNFKIEPPGLFRGRGDHPKQGMLKKRTRPEDVTLNCSKGSKIPIPPPGHKWKEVRHDNTVTWLASWSENIQGSIKYIMLNAASKLKGEKDWMKYETARRLHKCVDKIRRTYREDWKSKEMKIRQRAVALYFIDKLALRAGNEKDEDTADTVGCCSLRVEHIKLHEELNGQEFVVEFDFLGKDSIRYYNTVSIEKRVFKNLQLFMENKQDGDDVFDRLNTTILNKHLQSLMEGLTAKVFRTYNASHTLQEQLDLLTNPDDNIPAKLLSYNRANRAVAVLCNHQRAAPKNFDKQMENLQSKIDAKKEAIKVAKKELKDAKSDYKAKHSESARSAVTKKEKALERLKEQLDKLEVQATDKDENKEIALGTSKLNYLDPRITVSWCKKWNVPIEKVYNKTQREKFAWAIDMADKDYYF